MAKQLAKDNTKEQILETAKKLFRVHGFSGVSTNEIIKGVGIKKPTLYYYFKDKETLFCETLIYMLSAGNRYIVENIRPNDSLEKRLNILAEGYFEYSPTSLATMMRDAKLNLTEPNMKRVLEANQFYITNPFQQIFQEAVDSEELIHMDAKELALIFISFMDVYTVKSKVSKGSKFESKKQAKVMVDLFLNGALNNKEKY